MEGVGIVLFGLILIFLCVFWILQFTQLMLFSDSDFPGKYDKLFWVAAFVLVFALAPFAFYFWKRAYIEVKAAEQEVLKK